MQTRRLTLAQDIRTTKEADAAFYARKKEAEGLTEIAKAYGQMADVLGGPQGLLQYLMLQDKTYEKLALANAKAINGLQPKMTVWNTGADAATDSSAPLRNLFQSLPPLLSTIQEQTGMAPPNWMAQMPQQGQYSGQVLMTRDKDKNGLVNGTGKGH